MLCGFPSIFCLLFGKRIRPLLLNSVSLKENFVYINAYEITSCGYIYLIFLPGATSEKFGNGGDVTAAV